MNDYLATIATCAKAEPTLFCDIKCQHCIEFLNVESDFFANQKSPMVNHYRIVGNCFCFGNHWLEHSLASAIEYPHDHTGEKQEVQFPLASHVSKLILLLTGMGTLSRGNDIVFFFNWEDGCIATMLHK